MTFTVGLDLGQAQDYTAVSIVETIEAPREEDGRRGERTFHVRHLERFALRTTYTTMVARVAEMLRSKALAEHPDLVVDGTGCGVPVMDLLRDAGLNPVAVTITGGDTETRGERGEYRVPKRDLVGVMQVLLQSSRLKIAAELPEAPILQAELLNFQVKINLDTAHDSYGAWREGTHDDLVLSVALACWWGMRGMASFSTLDFAFPARDEDADAAEMRRTLCSPSMFDSGPW
jgi:hypothetical protein